MEGQRPDVARARDAERLQALAQLLRRLVRKGHGEHLPRRRGIDGAQAADIVRHVRASGCGVLERGEHRLVRVGRKLSRVRAAAKLQDVGHAVDQDRRFPTAGTREQKQRAFRRQNSFALFRVQIGIFFFNDLPPRGGKPAGKVLGHGEISSVS